MTEDIPGCHNWDGGNVTDTRDAAHILHGTGHTPTTGTDPALNVRNSEWQKPALNTHQLRLFSGQFPGFCRQTLHTR